MARARVLKPFPFSPDHIAIVHLAEGQEFDCPPEIVAGLEDARLIERIAAPETTVPAPAPENTALAAPPANAALAGAPANKRRRR